METKTEWTVSTALKNKNNGKTAVITHIEGAAIELFCFTGTVYATRQILESMGWELFTNAK